MLPLLSMTKVHPTEKYSFSQTIQGKYAIIICLNVYRFSRKNSNAFMPTIIRAVQFLVFLENFATQISNIVANKKHVL